MKTITKQYQIYDFDELSEEAQEKVLNDNYDINIDYEWWQDDDIYQEIAKDYGIFIDIKEVSFSLDRENYVAFDTFNHSRSEKWSLPIYIKDYKLFFKKAGLNTNLKRVKTEIDNQNINIDHTHYAGGIIANYIKDDYADITEEELEMLETCLNNMLDEIKSQLKLEYNDLTSKESIIDTIEANEYTFLENGTMFNI